MALISTTEDGGNRGLDQAKKGTKMAERAQPTCADCYFRRAGLCALRTETPCPTFRGYARGALAPSQQARLVIRPSLAFAAQHAAA